MLLQFVRQLVADLRIEYLLIINYIAHYELGRRVLGEIVGVHRCASCQPLVLRFRMLVFDGTSFKPRTFVDLALREYL